MWSARPLAAGVQLGHPACDFFKIIATVLEIGATGFSEDWLCALLVANFQRILCLLTLNDAQ